VSHGKATAYLPVIELLKSYFDIQSSDEERKRREKVLGKVLGLDRSLEDTLPYLFALLGIEEQPSPLAQMDPQIRRRRTFEALKKLFLRESLNQPLVLIFEDLHWIDGETQGFLDVLSESLASAKLLLLTNYRPEYRHEWGQKTYYTQLRLAPFRKEEAEEFLDVLLGDSPRPIGERDRVRGGENNLQPLKQLILDKTQGTPFFMEEIVQDLFEQGVLVRTEVGAVRRDRPSAETLQIPPTVQGLLAARIDRLAPEEKALLQQLAVIGRQFPLSLIRQVIAQPEADLYRLLASLQRKEFLYEQPAFPESEYIFKHALTQDVAYGTVLQEQKKLLHERTGQALEALYAATLPEHYSDLAHHYQRSGNVEKAVVYLHLAGQQAVQRSANTEAITHLTAALELLKTLPDTSERNQRELTLQLTLGVPLQATKGFASPDVERVYGRARELCQQLGEIPQLFTVLRGQWVSYNVQAQYQTAAAIGEQLLQLAQQANEPALLIQAHEACAGTAQFLGDVVRARAHCEKGLALYDPRRHHDLALVYGYDSGTACLARLILNLWVLGYPDQSMEKTNELFTLSQKLTHVQTQAMILSQIAFRSQNRRDEQLMQQQAEALITFAKEHGLSFMLALGKIQRGWALAEQGHTAEGIAQLREGLAEAQNTGGHAGRSYQLYLLADALAKGRQREESFAVLSQALDHVATTGERFHESQLQRLKGELTLQSKASLRHVEGKSQTSRSPSEVEQDAEACFLQAIAIAQRQQAKSLELRASTSLARLWQTQGKQHEARNMLADVYNWFTEGFDTKDLQEAKALIEELNR
jgi:predicted ATPase